MTIAWLPPRLIPTELREFETMRYLGQISINPTLIGLLGSAIARRTELETRQLAEQKENLCSYL